MPTTTAAKQVGKAVMQEAKQATAKPWVEVLARLGFLVRGLVYIVIGVLALQLASGAGGSIESPKSAVELLGAQPFGKVLVAVAAVGLAGYALWGYVRAIFDPLGRGTSRKGWMARAGFFFSGVSYSLLVYPIVQTLLNKPAADTAGSDPAGMAASPAGKWMAIGIGVIWLVAGGAQLVAAYRGRFLRDLKTEGMKAEEEQAMHWLGRIGYAARGVVFVLVGVLVFQTIFAGGAQEAPTFDGALATVAHSALGGTLLSLVALGLMMFGAYSALCAKWAKISVGDV